MILRRVIAHFRKQEWTAIAIDFLIVVGGVFVGIQVSNWNAARQDRKAERYYLERLRDELLSAETYNSRLVQSRMNQRNALTSATLALLGRSGQDALSDEECRSLATSHIFRVTLAELPAMTELLSAGRLLIIRNDKLRSALIAMQQAQDVLDGTMDKGDRGPTPLGDHFPGLIAVDVYMEDAQDRLRFSAVCDVDAMRADRAFLNALSNNAQRFDAYIQFYVEPWAAEFEAVRKLIDAELGIAHEPEPAP